MLFPASTCSKEEKRTTLQRNEWSGGGASGTGHGLAEWGRGSLRRGGGAPSGRQGKDTAHADRPSQTHGQEGSASLPGPPGSRQGWNPPLHQGPVSLGESLPSLESSSGRDDSTQTRLALAFLALPGGCEGMGAEGKLAGEAVILLCGSSNRLVYSLKYMPRGQECGLCARCLALHPGPTSAHYVALGEPLLL